MQEFFRSLVRDAISIAIIGTTVAPWTGGEDVPNRFQSSSKDRRKKRVMSWAYILSVRPTSSKGASLVRASEGM
jgi:hypothetical protein